MITDPDKLRGALRIVARYSGSDVGAAAIKEILDMFEELRRQLAATQQDRGRLLDVLDEVKRLASIDDGPVSR